MYKLKQRDYDYIRKNVYYILRIRQVPSHIIGRVGEDVAHLVCLKVVRYLHRYDPALPFRPWLKTVKRHRVLDYLESRQYACHFNEQLSESIGEVGSATNIPRWDQSAVAPLPWWRVQEFMAELSSKERDVFIRTFISGEPDEDVALETGLTVGSLRTYKSKLKKRIYVEFSEE